MDCLSSRKASVSGNYEKKNKPFVTTSVLQNTNWNPIQEVEMGTLWFSYGLQGPTTDYLSVLFHHRDGGQMLFQLADFSATWYENK